MNDRELTKHLAMKTRPVLFGQQLLAKETAKLIDTRNGVMLHNKSLKSLRNLKEYHRHVTSDRLSTTRGRRDTNSKQDSIVLTVSGNALPTLEQVASMNGTADLPKIIHVSKRHAECPGLRRRALCPWVYETRVNPTFQPPRVRVAVCNSGTTQLGELLVVCEQIYSEITLKRRFCQDEPDQCYEKVRLPVGCVAAVPCVLQSAGLTQTYS
ncbi:uncharacterized protein LOC128230004 [Mya arenaria]|uniref:uncharacterized protein LOC128230004 n=1 Tax=Mya arenaria TaxID=6604 RepID=UPI0022E3A9A1|nr:uncharacterized protein LOC128230004 [Mya arenaria]XP_052797935.1 uncharacterized protein LOC128230004 [Mya arenaria]XP_052797936.1 uncharacterized protein LOC128230004 [Mya arenaria]